MSLKANLRNVRQKHLHTLPYIAERLKVCSHNVLKLTVVKSRDMLDFGSEVPEVCPLCYILFVVDEYTINSEFIISSE